MILKKITGQKEMVKKEIITVKHNVYSKINIIIKSSPRLK